MDRADQDLITPEMIDAGVKVLRGFDAWFDLSPGLEELLVQEILRAALASVSEALCETGL